MEIIIKINIENLKVKRELICDICNGNIYSEDYVDTEIYAIFWKEKKELYLEKYICPDCYAKYYKKTKSIPFEQAPEVYKKALERDFGRNWHGIITPCSSMEEWKLLQGNPFLIEFWGNKF